MTIHFDVDQHLMAYLKGVKSNLSIREETLTAIDNKNRIEVVSIKSQSKISKEVLRHFSKLQLIVTRTVGVDHIDLSECKKRGVAVYNVPSYGSMHVAQHGVALMLSGARNIIRANKETHLGKFSYKNLLGISLVGKTLGVVGTGKIGLEFIKIARSLGMKIVAYDIFKNEKAAEESDYKYVTLDNLLKQSDVITLHIPSTPKTKHLLDAKRLKSVRQGAILVNTARGDLIDEKALVANIKKFHAVCLDVLQNEDKFSRTHPLLKFENVIITPHVAFYTDESIKEIARETLLNIERFRKGDKTNRVV